MSSAAARWADLLAMAKRADEVGFDSVSVPDGTDTLVYALRYEWKMLKLLNDDFLYSEMTQLHYDTSSKRVMRP